MVSEDASTRMETGAKLAPCAPLQRSLGSVFSVERERERERERNREREREREWQIDRQTNKQTDRQRERERERERGTDRRTGRERERERERVCERGVRPGACWSRMPIWMKVMAEAIRGYMMHPNCASSASCKS